jgi:hypothetical protein
MQPAPPPGCRDPRLWSEAHELIVQHAPRSGRCPVCSTAWPCRIVDVAEDAKRRAMPPDAAQPPGSEWPGSQPPGSQRQGSEPSGSEPYGSEPYGSEPPMAPPRRSVGARFPRLPADEPPEGRPGPEAEHEPVADEPRSLGARFRRESRIGRRRRNG